MVMGLLDEEWNNLQEMVGCYSCSSQLGYNRWGWMKCN